MPRSPGGRIMRSLLTTTLVLSLALLLAAPPARAGAPTDQLRLQVDRVLKLLDDPTLKDKPKDKRVAARKIADDIFDFGETARRSLGRHWAARTQAERDEFVKLFGDLLERSYISKIELYGGEKIQYVSDKIEGDQASVLSKLITKAGSDVPIEYRMLKKGDRKSTRLNSSHVAISYAVFCLKKKKDNHEGDASQRRHVTRHVHYDERQ